MMCSCARLTKSEVVMDIAILSCQFDTPGKKKPQLRNLFRHINIRACLWVISCLLTDGEGICEM